MELYYKRTNPYYNTVPPVMEGCRNETLAELEIVYPQPGSNLIIPTELDGSMGKVVLEVAHRKPEAKIFWHLDESYIGVTRSIHQFAVDMLPGSHMLTVIDEFGNSQNLKFEVLK